MVKDQNKLKNTIREEANEHGITHITIEIEDKNTKCEELECHIKNETKHHHHH